MSLFEERLCLLLYGTILVKMYTVGLQFIVFLTIQHVYNITIDGRGANPDVKIQHFVEKPW